MIHSEEPKYIMTHRDIGTGGQVNWVNLNLQIIDKFDKDGGYLCRTISGDTYFVYANRIKKLISKEEYEKV